MIRDHQIEDLVRACRVVFGEPSFVLFDAVERQLIDQRYRKRVFELHPDRALIVGVDESVLTRRFQDLQDAYALLREALGDADSLRVVLPVAQDDVVRPGGSKRHGGSASQSRDATGSASTPNNRARQRRARAAGQTDWPSSPWPRQEDMRDGPATSGRNAEQQQREQARESGPDRSRSRTDADRRRAQREAEQRAQQAREQYGRDGSPILKADAPAVLRQLYRDGYISRRQLIAGQVWLVSHRPMVGRLAVEWGFLTQRQVAAVLKVRQSGERFCDAAVRAGLISRFQRLALLGQQRKLELPLDSYLIEQQILTPQQLAEIKRTLDLAAI